MKMRQSAATWFQPASRTNASASPSSVGAILTSMGSVDLKDAIAGVVVGVLAEALHPATDPVGGPVDHPVERDVRRAEQALGGSGVAEPRRRCLTAYQGRCLAQPLPERLGEAADAHGLRTGDV